MQLAEKGVELIDKINAAIPEIVKPSDQRAELHKVYRDGLGRGDGVGWSSVSELFTVAPGQVTTVTGWPNSGKSQWLDNVILNITSRSRWHNVYCSLENIPVFLHVEKLAKLWIGKPMRQGFNERMTEDELDGAINRIDELVRFIRPTDDKPNPSVPDVMIAIEEEFKRQKIWATSAKLSCVIDPWNELEHFRPRGMSLTEYVGESLSRIRQWARRHGLHVFIIGHPAKQTRLRDTGKLPVPQPDMISDSAHFWNKSDNCITVHLPNDHDSNDVDIYVQKIRFGHIGRRGMVTLKYDVTTGRYHQPPTPIPGHLVDGPGF